MLVHGLIPGPALFREETTLVYVIFSVMFLSNILILVLGLRFAPLIARVTQIDKRYIIPVILILSITGPAVSAGHIYYFWITIIFGALGYVMDRHGFSVIGMAMGIILGPIIERNLRASLMLPETTMDIFLLRPFSLLFLVLTVLVIVLGIRRELRAG
jgi:putative tricarboxylic transport membrane protein